MHHPRFIPSAGLGGIALAVCAWSPTASAFMEDICYPSGGGAPPQNCLTLPAVCLPIGSTTPACRTFMSTQFLLEGSGQQQGARSTVHADATFLLAQSVGFSSDDAWWIAAFDEVCDYGTFQAYDMKGEPLDAATQTPTLEGLLRSNTATGGTFFHYVSTYGDGSGSPAPGLDGLVPDVTDESTEFFLAHLRKWAQAGTGPSRVLCTGGLTTESDAGSYGTGTDCYPIGGGQGARDAGNIVWSTAIFAAGKTITTTNTSGLQVIHHPDGGAAVLSPDFDSIVGAGDGGSARIMDARLGIYVHALADRISHNACTDTATVAGPSGDGWTESWTTGACDQGYHVLFHAWETGVDFSKVPAANQTTVSALSAVRSELLSFANTRGVAGASTADAGALLSDIATALETADAPGRIGAVAAVSCQYGLQPFPGAPACATSTADGGEGGSADGGEVGSADDGGEGGRADGGVDATLATTMPATVVGQSSSCSVGASVRGSTVPFAGAAAWFAVLGALGIRRRRAGQSLPRSA